MDPIAITFAKLAAVLQAARTLVAVPSVRYIDPLAATAYFEQAARSFQELKEYLPQLYGDFRPANVPTPVEGTDFEGRGHLRRAAIEQLIRDIEFVIEVRANSELATPAVRRENRVFIAHGRSPDWREVQAYLEKDLGLPTLELAQEPNQGRTVLQKLDEESGRCTYAVIVMTGDDAATDGTLRARENVMHEIGFFQGKFGLANVSLLHEEGTNIPSNIHGLVYLPYPKGMVSATFSPLARELKATHLTT